MSTRVRGNTLLEIWAIHTRPATKTWSSLCPLRDLDLRYLREIPCEMVPKRGFWIPSRAKSMEIHANLQKPHECWLLAQSIRSFHACQISLVPYRNRHQTDTKVLGRLAAKFCISALMAR